MKFRAAWIFPALLEGVLLSGCGQGRPGKVYFVVPREGQEVESPFEVRMAADNLRIEPESLGVGKGRGHFLLVVDDSLPPPGVPMAEDARHIRYREGQTEATLDLPPGEHSLALVFARGDGVPNHPRLMQTIRIRVVPNPLPYPAPNPNQTRVHPARGWETKQDKTETEPETPPR